MANDKVIHLNDPETFDEETKDDLIDLTEKSEAELSSFIFHTAAIA